MRRVEKGKGSRTAGVLKKGALSAVVLSAMLGAAVFAGGCASAELPDTGEGATDETVVQNLTGEDWAKYLPKVVTKEDGSRVQKTPFGGTPNGYFYNEDWNLYNTYTLNADNRGCSSCHDLADTMQGSLGHWLYKGNYDNEQIRYDDCFGCHEAYGVTLQDFQTAMHAHMDRQSFQDMGGTCNSCHYETADGEYKIWDDVKFDVMRGITDMPADTVNANVIWGQDEITPFDKMYVQMKKKLGWGFDVVPVADDIRDTYTVKFSGGMDNPTEMTIQQMIDQFGTETRTIANQCTINGTGGSYIYQAEVTGIPLRKVLETVGLHEDANRVHAVGVDGYDIPVDLEPLMAGDPLLVFEMNGEVLPQEQGYPLALWIGDGFSGGQMTRYLGEFIIEHDDDEGGAYNNFNKGVFGDYNDPRTGMPLNTPNIGVLTAESGQIFKAGEPVHLEGYAHAFEETVTKLEFSFDHGATWKEVPVDNADNEKWVYWKMDIDNLTEPGAYLMNLRATSVGADGAEHVNSNLPDFLINIEA